MNNDQVTETYIIRTVRKAPSFKDHRPPRTRKECYRDARNFLRTNLRVNTFLKDLEEKSFNDKDLSHTWISLGILLYKLKDLHPISHVGKDNSWIEFSSATKAGLFLRNLMQVGLNSASLSCLGEMVNLLHSARQEVPIGLYPSYVQEFEYDVLIDLIINEGLQVTPEDRENYPLSLADRDLFLPGELQHSFSYPCELEHGSFMFNTEGDYLATTEVWKVPDEETFFVTLQVVDPKSDFRPVVWDGARIVDKNGNPCPPGKYFGVEWVASPPFPVKD